MNRFKPRICFVLAHVIIVALAVPASASLPPVMVQAVRATEIKDATMIDITFSRDTVPTLQDKDGKVVVTVPNAAPAPDLANHLENGGLVYAIQLENEEKASLERITFWLASSGEGKLYAGSNNRTVRVVITPTPNLPLAASKTTAAPAALSLPASTPMRPQAMPSAVAIAASPARLYNVNAYQSDLVGTLNSLAQDAHVSVVMAGPISSKVSLNLRQVPLEKAIDLLTKAAGLAYHRDGDIFMVGDAKDLAVAYPRPDAVTKQVVYRCLHISASDLVNALQNTFDKDKLRVSVGAAPSSPRLDSAATGNVTGLQANTMKGGETATPGLNAHMVVLAGEESIVAQALALAQQLDARRGQVRIGVQITDINRDALRNLGVQWSFGSIAIHENQPSGIGFGSFTRDPFSVTATLSALENKGDAKLLAAPNISLLDGERGFILIGDRIQYPKLTGYTQAQTPIYDVTEERVGIYLQVAVQMEDNGEVTMTIYPQVSTVSGYLNVNGASYPQISTREQQTTIRVKDGQQVVVGGLMRDEEINNIQRVPILSKIPLFGELFTYRNKTKQHSEVVIIITPQILKD